MLVTAQEELLLARRLQGDDVPAPTARATQRAAELLASARRRLAYWDIPGREIAEIERTGVVRNALTLRAPAGGYVLEKTVLAGQKIMAGDPLYRVADLGTVWVEGEVFEQDLASVRVGQTVRAEFQALPGEHRTGRIAYVYPTLNPDDAHGARPRRARRTAISGSSRGCTPRSASRAARASAVLTVPRSARALDGRAQHRLRPRRERRARRRARSSLGASNDDRVEILRGAAAGETVVASATFLVDAESNLGTALGGMGDMPGMELTTPPKPLDAGAEATRSAPGARRADAKHVTRGVPTMLKRIIEWSVGEQAPRPAVHRGGRRSAGSARSEHAARGAARPVRRAGDRAGRLQRAGAAHRRGPGHVPDRRRDAEGAGRADGARLLVLRRLVRLRDLRGRHRPLLGADARAGVPERHQGEAARERRRPRSAPTRPGSAGSISTRSRTRPGKLDLAAAARRPGLVPPLRAHGGARRGGGRERSAGSRSSTRSTSTPRGCSPTGSPSRA